MITSSKTVKQVVRQAYGSIAAQGSTLKDCAASCGCAAPDTGTERMSTALGYSETELKKAPEGADLGLGCGNPRAIAGIKKGEVVVDLGSGGGLDCFLAAAQVGEKGQVIGVDMTPEMITRARENKEKASAGNVEFRLGEIEHLPVADNTADLVISNCVINLSPEKEQVFRDAFRVLKPGGRLAVSDILALKPLPLDIKKDLNLVSACIGGAATIESTRRMLEKAGFKDICIDLKPMSPELVESCVSGSTAADYVAPANITAEKACADAAPGETI